MITLTIEINQGTAKIGVAISIKGTKTATMEELFELGQIMEGIQRRPDQLVNDGVDGFMTAFGKGKKASNMLRKRIRDL